MKHYTKNPRNQVKVQRKLNRSPREALKTILEAPVSFFNSLDESDIQFLDYFLYTRSKFKSNYKSQVYIAADLGISVRSVQRKLDKFWGYGLISSFYRHRKTCFYNVSQIFFHPAFKIMLKLLLPSIKALPLLITGLTLLHNPKTLPTGLIYTGVVPSYKEDYNLYKYISKKGEYMRIPDTIKKLRSLNLTMSGKKELAKLNLPESAIKHAEKNIQIYKNRTVLHLFKLFVMMAAREAKLEIDWEKLPPESVLLENTTINTYSFNSSTKGKDVSNRPKAWKPQEPYHRSADQQAEFKQQQKKNSLTSKDLSDEEKLRLRQKSLEFLKIINKGEYARTKYTT